MDAKQQRAFEEARDIEADWVWGTALSEERPAAFVDITVEYVGTTRTIPWERARILIGLSREAGSYMVTGMGGPEKDVPEFFCRGTLDGGATWFLVGKDGFEIEMMRMERKG